MDLKKAVPYRLTGSAENAYHLWFQTRLRKHMGVVAAKWEEDLSVYGDHLEKQKELYFTIQLLYVHTFGKTADLQNPTSYNEKIQWLKLFNQHRSMIDLCDKLKVRNVVAEKVGKEILTKIYQVTDNVEHIDVSALPASFVVKTNHDSGGVFPVEDKSRLKVWLLKNVIHASFSRTYGEKKGEWPYKHITRKVFAEEYLDSGNGSFPSDYKFHCVDGKVKWLQYIYNRGRNTKEFAYGRDFQKLDLHLDHEFSLHDPNLERPQNWDVLVNIAETISEGMKYVRVDLYNIRGKIFFGELTFFPKAGMYPGKDQEQFGAYLNFDRSHVRPL